MSTQASDTRIVFRKQDRIGSNDAEEDSSYLASCFVDTGDLTLLRDCNRAERIVLGRTGVGKTALLRKLCDAEDRAIEIRPENLALAYVANSNIIRFMEDLGVNLETFYKLIWRHAFCVELLRARFGVGPNQDVSIREKVKAFFKGNKFRSAIEYLEKWGDRFWEDTEVRVKEITTRIERSLESSMGADAKVVKLGTNAAASLSEEQRAEIVQRAQKVVNEAHVPQLTHILDLVDGVLDDPQKSYYLVIDRLDEAWVDDSLRYKLIMALIDTVKDFRRVKNVKIVLALRLDLLQRVFARARTSGFQEEKFHSLYLRVRWNRTQLLQLLNTRIGHLFRDRYSGRRAVTYEDILIGARRGQPPIDYILERTCMRPRDVIAFFNECIDAAEGNTRITMKDIQRAELPYSRSRLQSVSDEWHVDYPNLSLFARSLLGGAKSPCRVSELLPEKILEDKILDLSTAQLADDELGRSCTAVVESEIGAPALLRRAVSIFYRCGVISLKLSPHESHTWYSETWRRVSPTEISDDVSIAVHPMLWRALDIETA